MGEHQHHKPTDNALSDIISMEAEEFSSSEQLTILDNVLSDDWMPACELNAEELAALYMEIGDSSDGLSSAPTPMDTGEGDRPCEGNSDCYHRHDYHSRIDPLYSDTCAEVFEQMKESESKYHPTVCLFHQPQINQMMRARTICYYIINLSHMLNICSESVIHLAVNITDRITSYIPMTARCYQLFAVAALRLAAKKEERITPSVQAVSEAVTQIAQVTKSSLSHICLDQLINVELLILRRLDFGLHVYTDYHFIHCVKEMYIEEHRLDVCYRELTDSCNQSITKGTLAYDVMQFKSVVRSCAHLYSVLNIHSSTEMDVFIRWAVGTCRVGAGDLKCAIDNLQRFSSKGIRSVTASKN